MFVFLRFTPHYLILALKYNTKSSLWIKFQCHIFVWWLYHISCNFVGHTTLLITSLFLWGLFDISPWHIFHYAPQKNSYLFSALMTVLKLLNRVQPNGCSLSWMKSLFGSCRIHTLTNSMCLSHIIKLLNVKSRVNAMSVFNKTSLAPCKVAESTFYLTEKTPNKIIQQLWLQNQYSVNIPIHHSHALKQSFAVSF